MTNFINKDLGQKWQEGWHQEKLNKKISSKKYKVLDNFISEKDANIIEKDFFSHNFPWYFSEKHDYKKEEDIPKFFSHLFYDYFSVQSKYFYLIEPILHKLNPTAIIRIKGNVFFKTKETKTYGYHKDYENTCLTAVYYVNDNDGYTIFNDGTKIESKKNRILIFESDIVHAGTNCSNEYNRSIINFNYIVS